MNASKPEIVPLPKTSAVEFYDPIWNLVREFTTDERLGKREFLTGQVLRSENLVTCPAVMSAAKYALQGLADFGTALPEGNQAQLATLLSFLSPKLAQAFPISVHALGATGGLFAVLSWLKQACGLNEVFVSDPSWPNHEHIIRVVGAEPIQYPYWRPSEPSLRAREMIEVLGNVGKTGGVILQPCCHNPTGLSPSPREWSELARVLAGNGTRVVFDASYVGLSEGFSADLSPVEHFVGEGCPLILIVSCSKLFGLYSERIGGVYIFNPDERMRHAHSMLTGILRATWSSPNTLGLSIVNEVLTRTDLCADWQEGLAGARTRMKEMRRLMCEGLNSLGMPSGSLSGGAGVFGMLPLTREEIVALRENFAIYLLENGRTSFARAWGDEAILELCNALGTIRRRSSQ